MPMTRRARGALLRLVRRRGATIALGLMLAVPAAFVQLSDRYDAWWMEGLSVAAGATGIALIWSGVVGPKKDWVE
jgi:hypothetical protein